MSVGIAKFVSIKSGSLLDAKPEYKYFYWPDVGDNRNTCGICIIWLHIMKRVSDNELDE